MNAARTPIIAFWAIGAHRQYTTLCFNTVFKVLGCFVVSYGKERPLDLGHDNDAWALNRRCEFRLKP